MRRLRPVVQLTLSRVAVARLDEIAARRGETRSGIVEMLARSAEMPRAKPSVKQS